MTDQLSFDGLLTAALADGPTRAPAAIVDAAVVEAGETVQRRAGIARLDARAWPAARGSVADPILRRNLRLILVVAAVVVALAAAAVVGSKLLSQFVNPLRTTALVSAGQLPIVVRQPIVRTLPGGRLLIGGDAQARAIAVVFDPATRVASPLETGFQAVSLQGLAALPDGRFALLGWQYEEPGLPQGSRMWLFDPGSRQLSTSVLTRETRFAPSVAALPDGRVIVLGGLQDLESAVTRSTTEVFDPTTMTFSAGPFVDALPSEAVVAATRDGAVLIVGGATDDGQVVNHPNLEIDVFDPASGTMRSIGQLAGRAGTGISGRSHLDILSMGDDRFLVFENQVGPQLCGRHGIDPVAAQIVELTSGRLIDAAPVDHAISFVTRTMDGRFVVGGQWVAIPGGCGSGSGDYITNSWLGIYDPAIGLTSETADPIAKTRTLALDMAHGYIGGSLLADGTVALVSDVLTTPDGTSEIGNFVDRLSLEPR